MSSCSQCVSLSMLLSLCDVDLDSRDDGWLCLLQKDRMVRSRKKCEKSRRSGPSSSNEELSVRPCITFGAATAQELDRAQGYGPMAGYS